MGAMLMNRVMVVSPVIRPGGGPAGYVHNLAEGVKACRNDLANTFSFVGEISPHRSSLLQKSLVTSGDRRWGLRTGGAASTLLRGANHRFRTHLDRREFEFKRSAREHHLVVLHGLQSVYRARFVKRRTSAKLVYMPHSPTPTAYERAMVADSLHQPLPHSMVQRLLEDERETISRADAVVFPSPGAAEAYTSAFAAELDATRVLYVRSGVPATLRTDTALPPGTPENRQFGLFVGRYVEHKGYDLFCQAAEDVTKRSSDYEFRSLGTGPVVTSGPVLDLGWSDTPHSVMLRAAFVAISNRQAYYDLLPLECASIGVPLVMTPVGGNVDQQSLLPDSILTAGASRRDLADGMLEAFAVKQENPGWGARNVEAFREHFTIEAMARAWDEACNTVLAG